MSKVPPAVVVVVLPLSKPALKKDIRRWVEDTLRAQAEREGWVLGARVRSVETD